MGNKDKAKEQLTTELHELRQRLAKSEKEKEELKRSQATTESKARPQIKVDNILLPEAPLETMELSDIIDTQEIQFLMDDFYHLTNIGVAILDLHGKILVATGWQDVCTKFHRIHPETCKNCLESDIELSDGVEPGTFRLYHCKNNMWDMSTPITVGGKRVGNLYLGQFFFADESLDMDLFRSQARRYGFDEKEYLAAVESVPRWNRDTVNTVISFYTKLAHLISELSYRNVKLAQTLTEKDQFLESLRQSEEQFKAMFETASIGMAQADPQTGQWLRVNRKMCEITGYSPAEMVAMRVPEITHLEDRERDWAAFQNVVSGKSKSYRLEKRYIRKDDKIIWVNVNMTVIRDPSGQPTRTMATIEDITDRKRAEQALRESEDRFRKIYEHMAVGVARVSMDFRIEAANKAYCSMLGYQEEELIGKHLKDITHPEVLEENLLKQSQLAKGEIDHFRMEKRFIHKKGRTIHGILDANLVRDAEDKPLYFLGSVLDITDRKLAEEALRESELKYRSVVENIQDVFYRVDAEGRLALISTSAAQILGYDSVDDLVGQRSEILWADPSKRLALLDELDRCGLVREWEFEAICRNGSVLLAAATVHLIHDDNGNPIGYEGIWRDIAAHKRAEDQIRRANEYLENVFESSPDGIGIVDSGGKFIKWNRMAAEMYGYTFEELRGKSFLELYADQDNLDRMLGELRRNGSVKKYEINMKKKDGSVFSAELSISILKGDENRTLGSVCVVRDQSEIRKALKALEASNKRLQLEITERTRAEEALRVSQQIIEGIIYSAPVRVFWKDKNLTYLGCNAMFAHDAGFTDPKYIIGKDDSQMAWRDQAELYGNDDREVIEKGCSKLLIEEPQTTPEGNTITLLTNKIPLRGHKGEIIGVLGTYMDITERKLAEEEKAKIELQSQQLQKAESLGRMAGSIAHHFNNLLGAVIGNLELALDDLPQESDARESIVESLKASRRAAEISRLMLAYLGQITVRREPLDLVEAIRETLPLLAASVPQEVRFNAQLPPDGPIILADGVHIKQILTNLVTNAVEAIDESAGEITLSILSVSKAEMQGLRFNPMDWRPKADSYACLLVADRGCGMDELTREKIFDPFFSTKFTGRGLGLAVVLGLVRAHDGAITVESSFGGGSVFRVFLPLATRVPPSLQEEPFVSTPMKDARLVLLVDDEPMMRNMAQAMLKRKLGYEVITASDGYEAVEILRVRRDEIKLVILDLSMPGMNGWETLAALRALRSDIAVVLASGYDEAQVMQGDHPDRPQAFIHKPYQSKGLQAAIEAALRRPVNR